MDILRGDTGGIMTSLFGAAKSAWAANKAGEKTKKTKTSPADVVMWSGCKDNQTVSFFRQRPCSNTQKLMVRRARMFRKMAKLLEPCPTYVRFLPSSYVVQITYLTLDLGIHLSSQQTT